MGSALKGALSTEARFQNGTPCKSKSLELESFQTACPSRQKQSLGNIEERLCPETPSETSNIPRNLEKG
jgi:hypothetical protein